MNLEQRGNIYRLINQTQGLLEFAVRTGDRAEEARLRGVLAELLAIAD